MALEQLLADLQTRGVTEEELSRAKLQIRANAILGNWDLSSQGMQLGESQTATGDYRYRDRYLVELASVSKPDVQRVAREYLKPARRTAGFLNPPNMRGKAALQKLL